MTQTEQNAAAENRKCSCLSSCRVTLLPWCFWNLFSTGFQTIVSSLFIKKTSRLLLEFSHSFASSSDLRRSLFQWKLTMTEWKMGVSIRASKEGIEVCVIMQGSIGGRGGRVKQRKTPRFKRLWLHWIHCRSILSFYLIYIFSEMPFILLLLDNHFAGKHCSVNLEISTILWDVKFFWL